jgi:hypothetical protein
MSVTINGTSGLVFNDASTQATAATGFGFKNRIINGAMVIDQRNAGASVTPTTTVYLIDRWQTACNIASKASFDQTTTAPTGFTNSMLITSLSAYSVAAGDILTYRQQIEGFNIADFGWGTASAATITVSFWVRSSLTGTFGGSVKNGDSTRSYPFTYTISAANTFEQKTVTIAGDTSGTWPTDNTSGLILSFGLGVGSTTSGTAGAWAGANYNSATGATSVVGTSGATFYITGVQLEKGSTATSFDVRSYPTELMMCQRYFERRGNNGQRTFFSSGGCNATDEAIGTFYYMVVKRDTPTFTVPSAAGAATVSSVGVATNSTASGIAVSNISTESAVITVTCGALLTVGRWALISVRNDSNSSYFIGVSAEL